MIRLVRHRPHVRLDAIATVLDLPPETILGWMREGQIPCCVVYAKQGTFVEESAASLIVQAKVDDVANRRWQRFVTNNNCRRKLTEAEKKAVAAEQRYRCAMCDEVVADYEIDHVEQQCIRNNHHRSNLQMLCVACHRAKTRRDRQFLDPLFQAPVERGNVFAAYFRRCPSSK